MMEEENVIRPHQEIQALTFEEKKFLLAVERGDVAGTRRFVVTAIINLNRKKQLISIIYATLSWGVFAIITLHKGPNNPI